MPTINYQYSGQFAPGTYLPQFDPTGLSLSNKVTQELHTVTTENASDFHVVVPLFAPFFSTGLIVKYKATINAQSALLLEGIDYNLAYQFIGATRACAKGVYGAISLLDNNKTGIIELQYQSLGGNWVLNSNQISSLLANQLQNPRVTSWEQIVSLPNVFPVVDHQWNLQDLIGASHVVQAIEDISLNLSNTSSQASINDLELIIDTHTADQSNPHNVTKQQLGLGNVDNTSDVNKPVSAAQAAASAAVQTAASTDATTKANAAQAAAIAASTPVSHLTQVNPHPEYLTAQEGLDLINDVKFTSFKQTVLSTFDNVSQNDAVRFDNLNLSKALANNINPNNLVIGFADKTNQRVIYSGLMDGFSGLITGNIYYLSPLVPGGITATKPNIDAIRVGVAKSATELFVGIMAAAQGQTMPVGGEDDKIFYLNGKIVNYNFTILSNQNAMSAGPIEIADGVIVEAELGSVWTIV